MQTWPAPDVPTLPGNRAPGPGARHRHRQGRAGRAGPDRAALRLRDHALRRDPHGPRRDLRRLRPARPGLARQRSRRALRAERHRRRRPAARARGRHRAGLAGARRARDRAVPRGHGGAARASRRSDYIGAVESIPLVVDYVHQLQESGAVYAVDGDLYFSVRSDPRFGSVSGLDEAQMLAVFGERGGDPGRPGKKDAAGLPAVAGAACRGTRVGQRAGARAAGLAHRVHRDRADLPRHDHRRAGRRQRPGVPPPRDGCVRGAGGDR